MSSKFLIPALLVSLLAGCASTTVAATDDWVNVANPAGVIMTDGHLAEADTPAVARAAPRSVAAAPAAVPMTDGHPELETAARTIKGGGSAN